MSKVKSRYMETKSNKTEDMQLRLLINQNEGGEENEANSPHALSQIKLNILNLTNFTNLPAKGVFKTTADEIIRVSGKNQHIDEYGRSSSVSNEEGKSTESKREEELRQLVRVKQFDPIFLKNM